MGLPIGIAAKVKAEHLICAHWKPKAIARDIHCSTRAVEKWRKRLQMYHTIDPPYTLPLGRPRRIIIAAKEAVLEYLRQRPWSYQDELAIFLEEEWRIRVSQPTISRLLKVNKISLKKGQRIGQNQSLMLRNSWQAFMHEVTAEQLVFLDESIFKEQTGWRCMAYAPIGQPARWSDDMTRGKTWSILPAYTIDGYLPCTSIREGYYNQEAFLTWITHELLPHCNPYPEPRSIICLDNGSHHLDPRVEQVSIIYLDNESHYSVP